MSRCSGIQLGWIDYERKEKGSISGDGLGGKGDEKEKKKQASTGERRG